MGYVYKRKGRGGTYLHHYYLRFLDEFGRERTVSAGTPDKRVAEAVLRKFETRVAGIAAGTVDEDAESLVVHAKRPISEVKDAYLDQFETKGKRRGRGRRSTATIRDEKSALSLFFGCDRAQSLRRLGDLNGSSFRRVVEAVARKWRADSLVGVTINKRIGAVSRMLEWCVDEGFMGGNALDTWKPEEEEPTRQRRPLTDAEVERLLEVAGHRGRDLFYLAAVRTGLRRSELRRLAWGDVHLDGARGAIYFPAHKAKSRRDAVVPLTDDLRAALVASKPLDVLPTAPVFRTIPSNATRVKDFERAKIAPVDEEGRHADLHSLRSTLGTTLARKGVSPQLTQTFMRHSDFRTTREFYVHLKLEDLDSAARALEDTEMDGGEERSEEVS